MKKIKKPEIHEVILVLVILIQLAFVILKAVGIVAWAWWIVALPVIIAILIIVVLLVIIVAVVGDEEGFIQ